MENKLIEIQEMIMRQMRRLDDDKLMKENAEQEISRGNTLSLNATTLMKTFNIGLRVIEMTQKFDLNKETLEKELGIKDEK